jgi:hypothetical protein
MVHVSGRTGGTPVSERPAVRDGRRGVAAFGDGQRDALIRACERIEASPQEPGEAKDARAVRTMVEAHIALVLVPARIVGRLAELLLEHARESRDGAQKAALDETRLARLREVSATLDVVEDLRP